MTRAENLHRTAKQLFESGQASSFAEAEELLRRLVLQVDVGPDLHVRPAEQAALMTSINAGARAFLGGVRVRLVDDRPLGVGWAAGASTSVVSARFGGELVSELDPSLPTIAINSPQAVGSVIMHTRCVGWSGGVVQDARERGEGHGMPLAGVVAGGLAVSEAFQHACRAPEAARRDVGLSLWEPGTDWRSCSVGPALAFLPLSLWLLGPGHLGQAYAWSLGMLPYQQRGDLTAYLVDTDFLITGNLATGLLSTESDVRSRKTRVVAAALESRGFKTAIVERLFDEHTWPSADEPTLALAGFDSPVPRAVLGDERFARVVDAGLGRGAVEYLDMVLHTFPSQLSPATEFAARQPSQGELPELYSSEIDDLVAAGASRAEAECGMAEIAGISVAASFVGGVAGALVVADVLRSLHGGREIAILQLDLRTPNELAVVDNRAADRANPGFVRLRR